MPHPLKPRTLTIQVGLPRTVPWHGRRVTTGIFKEPVTGPVIVTRLNLAGDAQADLTVHGGLDKAIYCYPSEHYPYWQAHLPDVPFPSGAFGENLTTCGLREETLAIGDRFRIGTTVVEVTQPRLPCFKLGVRFNRLDMPRHFLASGRLGFYLRVLREGVMASGDVIEPLLCALPRVTVAELAHLVLAKEVAEADIQRVQAVRALPQVWRDYFGAEAMEP